MIGGFIGLPIGGVLGNATTANILGSVNQTLGAATQSSASKVFIRASGSETIGAVTQTSAAKIKIKAQSSQAIGAISPTAVGKLLIKAAYSQTLGDFLGSESGGLRIHAALNQEIGAVSFSSTGHLHYFDITDTDDVELPVDYALAGEQLIKDRYREWFVPAAKTTERTRVTTAGARMLGGKKSSFTSKTDSRGYD